jgi:chromosome segregation protein
MLKALELHGFKSFADRARFEFSAGITVIVGPNGSGKSNIVDAIKWVLGEQSAKSLRGKEMADVIFKGSGQGGRRPMNTAEATLVFDNADHRLPIDAPEVHITRRVYRSGEGEYLINRQPARLKDIRDLFRGTGVGVDAYSLIEQGKVDRLLQASAKDRRAIFEEAAGISRFKAKKVESQRRLERVEQNMLRLADIVEEVENRLKTVRAQAGKARRYREYSERLQQLRTQMALVDWRKLTERIEAALVELAAAKDQTQAADAHGQLLESRQLELETSAITAGEELRNCENQLAAARQQIAGSQAAVEHERLRMAELEEEAQALGRNLLGMSDKALDLRSRIKSAYVALEAAVAAHDAATLELSRHDGALQGTIHQIAAARQQADVHQEQFRTRLQEVASLTSETAAAESGLAATRSSIERHGNELSGLTGEESRCLEELAAAETRHQALAAELSAHVQELKAADGELLESRNLYGARAADLAQLHARQAGIAKRAEVLEEFERTLEGVGTGVKELLARAGLLGERPSSVAAPWSSLRGVVADFLKVGVEHAAAIDAALGELAQAVVVEGGLSELEAIARQAGDLAGRVALMPAELPSSTFRTVELSAEAVEDIQVIGRADKLVECADEHRALAERLLGRTFVVRTLDDALQLHQRAEAPLRVATADGEVVDEYGALSLGPRQAATSLISRRSQLRASRLELAVLDQQIIDAERETGHLKREIDRWERSLRELNEAQKSLHQREQAALAAATHSQQELATCRRRRTVVENELDAAKAAGETEAQRLELLRQSLSEAQRLANAEQTAIHDVQQSLAKLESVRQHAAGLAMTARVELVRCEQRVESTRQELARLGDDSRDRERTISDLRAQLAQSLARREASAVVALNAAAAMAESAVRCESLAAQWHVCQRERDAAARQRTQCAEELATFRREALRLRDKEHELALAVEQVRHQRQTLADRLREDYQIDLAELTHEPTPEEAHERAAVEEEIESLRRKINQIGAVNLDALEELDELEQRFGRLSAQYQDLSQAKAALERIIHKINADSRRLFLETLEAIRLNFQALYRKAFGGGKADLVLEEGVDVLECGVEILATPPGKPSFNNSLLSGGEKALTAVALLLAIFQFRPSPFCILDEVDAPFDEANIGRFIDVLKDFLGWTRFVIVTHSKKTMTAATTLYGVTMQESGVSKRVSVRFDDVTEDGHIRREALDRAAAENAA